MGRSCKVRVLGEREYREELKKKLSEEIAEFLGEESLDELADILEVVYGLAQVMGASREALESVRREKAAERGGVCKADFFGGGGVYLIAISLK